jgi:hypothetical protein
MKNIYLIPTDKPSRIRIGNNGNFVFGLMQNSITSKNDSYTNQHIYITNDEKIKEGDWFLPKGHINPHKLKGFNKINGDLESYNGLCYDISKCKKIILTDNKDLIKDGIQAINDEFLEWFVKNPSCEFIKTKLVYDYEEHPELVGNPKEEWSYYKIIIPKEEPKQETPEEAAQKQWGNVHRTGVLGFIEGAKWQQERMYSEEDMVEFSKWRIIYEDENPNNVKHSKKLLKEWFEQFKKK